MRRLIISTFMSLDGVMQAPGGPGEDDDGDFPYGGWTVNYWDKTMDAFMDKSMGKPFDLVLGRKTYDIFAGYWPNAPEEAGGRPLNEATKYVASRGRPTLEWQNSVLLEGDVAQAVAAIKQGDGPELQVMGSGDLAQTLMSAGLVDEFRLMIFPVLLGQGKRLFADGTIPSGLKLVEHEVSGTGVLIGVYQVAGEVTTGSFG